MGDLRESRQRRRADLLRRAVIADEFGEAGFDRQIALLQRIIGRVGNLGRVLAVIEIVVARNLCGEPFEFGLGFGFGEGLDQLGVV